MWDIFYNNEQECLIGSERVNCFIIIIYQAMCNSTNCITSEVFPQKEMLSLKRPETVREVFIW